jgi:hypothetical protein
MEAVRSSETLAPAGPFGVTAVKTNVAGGEFVGKHETGFRLYIVPAGRCLNVATVVMRDSSLLCL